jgi:oxygen-dependent protoporphyrinogen oxidase
MVPEDLTALDASPLFSHSAKQSYANELQRAEELKASAPTHDESVADFVRRHFGDEVLNTLAAPLLSGVFGGNVHKLSVRAVMPQFVAIEREHGSLVAALQTRARQRTDAHKPIFTSLQKGTDSIVHALQETLPNERVHLGRAIRKLDEIVADECVVATSLDGTRALLQGLDDAPHDLLPSDASSAVLVAFAWPEEMARRFTIPSGFGFLVPDESAGEEQLLACTFVDQKFPDRAPEGARIIRAFFGSRSAKSLTALSHGAIAVCALQQIREILGPIPEPSFHAVRRWPRSLPQYEVGHLERIAQLEKLVAQIPGLYLLGNSYHGVGIPDLIRDARATARKIIAQL